jgi:hypothetical protein
MTTLKLSPDVAALNPGVGARLETSAPRVKGRQALGDGGRQAALNTLAARGWCRTTYDATGHWMRHIGGRESARYPTYRELIDALLAGDAAACGAAEEELAL